MNARVVLLGYAARLGDADIWSVVNDLRTLFGGSP